MLLLSIVVADDFTGFRFDEELFDKGVALEFAVFGFIIFGFFIFIFFVGFFFFFALSFFLVFTFIRRLFALFVLVFRRRVLLRRRCRSIGFIRLLRLVRERVLLGLLLVVVGFTLLTRGGGFLLFELLAKLIHLTLKLELFLRRSLRLRRGWFGRFHRFRRRGLLGVVVHLWSEGNKLLRLGGEFGGFRWRGCRRGAHGRNLLLERAAQLLGEFELFARGFEILFERHALFSRGFLLPQSRLELGALGRQRVLRLAQLFGHLHRLSLHLLSHNLETIGRRRRWCG